MPRNLDRRVEIAFPVLDPHLQRRIREILEIQLADTVKARRILPDGSSRRVTPGDEPPLRSQERLYALAGPAGDLGAGRSPRRGVGRSSSRSGMRRRLPAPSLAGAVATSALSLDFHACQLR